MEDSRGPPDCDVDAHEAYIEATIVSKRPRFLVIKDLVMLSGATVHEKSSHISDRCVPSFDILIAPHCDVSKHRKCWRQDPRGIHFIPETKLLNFDDDVLWDMVTSL